MMGKTIREAVAELSKDVSYLELSCENDKLKYGIKQLTNENQRLKEQLQTLIDMHGKNQRLKEQLAESEQELTDLLESEDLLEQNDE